MSRSLGLGKAQDAIASPYTISQATATYFNVDLSWASCWSLAVQPVQIETVNLGRCGLSQAIAPFLPSSPSYNQTAPYPQIATT